MFRTFSIATAIAAALSVPIVASSGTSPGSAPVGDDVATPTSTTSVGLDGEAAGTAPPIEVVHVETDTNFASMSTQGTVLFAETMAPTDSSQPGWWLRVDVTVRNNGDQPIEVTDLGITTDASALDVEPLAPHVVLDPGDTELMKPHNITGSGTPPTSFTINVYAPDAAPYPAQATYPLDVYDDATATGGYRFPARAADLSPGVFWTPGSFHKHSRSQRYAYDLKAIRWDHDRGKWEVYTEQAFDDAENGIALGSKNEHFLIWGQPVYAMASGWSVSCRRSQPDHLPGGAYNVPGANSISIDHGNGEFAAYAHLMQYTMPISLCAAEAPVDANDPQVDHEPVFIYEGQFLGLAGNSGPSDGPHLHVHLVDSGPEVPDSRVRGLPLNFHDVFVHAYDGFDPTVHEVDWNWVTTAEAAAIGYRQLIHPNSCGWDAADEIGGYTTGGRVSPPPLRDCDDVPDPLARPVDDPVVTHPAVDDLTPKPRPRVH